MKDKFLGRHFGFTLPEVIIAITIMGVMAAAVTMSSNVGKQTAKSEAEKITAEILRLMKTADKTHNEFELVTQDKSKILYVWNNGSTINPETLASSDKFTYELKINGSKLNYSLQNNGFNKNGHIIIRNKADTSQFYCIYFYEQGGRIRTTPTED